jgi:carbonic anhydrase/acetyltransferase-like protein (isoleucine patch superfamily)
MGSPGRVVRELSGEQIEKLRHSAEHYVGNMRRYRDSLRADERS